MGPNVLSPPSASFALKLLESITIIKRLPGNAYVRAGYG
jgi:hypothetical protein